MARLTGAAPVFAGYLLSDMLLLEGLLKVTQAQELRVAEAEINNVARLPLPSCVLMDFEPASGRYALRLPPGESPAGYPRRAMLGTP